MENSPMEEQIKSLLKEIMIVPFSETSAIVETERQLKLMYQQNPTLISILIALLFCNLLQGKREIAQNLSNRIWSEGGELSDFFELVYTDCLLNLGEVEKAYDLLEQRLQNPQDSFDYFYMVMVKYALIKGDLFLLKQLGDYPGIYQLEPTLFDFARTHAFNSSSIYYKQLLKEVYSIAGQSICAVDYAFYNNGIELLFYTNVSDEQNDEWEQILSAKTEAFFEENDLEEIDDLSINLLNISEHPAWAE